MHRPVVGYDARLWTIRDARHAGLLEYAGPQTDRGSRLADTEIQRMQMAITGVAERPSIAVGTDKIMQALPRHEFQSMGIAGSLFRFQARFEVTHVAIA